MKESIRDLGRAIGVALLVAIASAPIQACGDGLDASSRGISELIRIFLAI
jgi:hypothetical protein